jgi:hypothetical protein
VPKVGAKIYVFFSAGEFDAPVYFANCTAESDGPANRQPERTILKTRTGHTVTISDKSGEAKIDVVSAAGHRVLLDDENTLVTVWHKDGEKVVLTSSEVQLGSGALKKLVNETFQALFDAHTHSAGLLLDSTPAPCTGTTGVPTSGMSASQLTAQTKAS